MDEKSARARNPRIEALRLAAFLVGGVLADLDLGPLSRALVPLILVAVAIEAIASIVLLALFFTFDQLVRLPALRLAHLA